MVIPISGFLVLKHHCFAEVSLKTEIPGIQESVLASMAADYCSSGPTEPRELLNLLALRSVLDGNPKYFYSEQPFAV